MTTKAQLLRSIRANCLQCCCGSINEVRDCEIDTCPMHKFRFGTDPTSKKRNSK
jgi:hypothetical protein